MLIEDLSAISAEIVKLSAGIAAASVASAVWAFVAEYKNWKNKQSNDLKLTLNGQKVEYKNISSDELRHILDEIKKKAMH